MIVLHDLNGNPIKLESSRKIAAVPRKKNYDEPTTVLIYGIGNVEVKESSDEIIEKIQAEAIAEK